MTLFRVLHFWKKEKRVKKKKNRQIFAPAAKKRYRTSLSASRILSTQVSSLSRLSPLSSPNLLWKKANPKRSSKEEEEEEEGVVLLFDSSREEGRAREREFFLCRACAGGFKFKTPGNQKTISGNSHFSLAIISIERFGRVGTRSVRRETAVFFVCAL